MNALRLAVAAVAVVCGGASAVAESPVCVPLRSDYVALLKASTVQGAGNTTALKRQLGQLNAQAQQGNCNRFLFFGPTKSPACPMITANIVRVRQQLAASSGNVSLFGRSPQGDRASLKEALLQNGCSVPSLSAAGRTLCVRTCDGYYFPLNYRVSASRAKADAATCQAMHGGEEGAASLFVQKSNDVAEARSIDGKRYGDQAYAFFYRQTYNPACHALLKDGMASFAATALAKQDAAAAEETPVALSDVAPAIAALQAISAVQQPVSAKRPRFVGDAYYQRLFAYGDD